MADHKVGNPFFVTVATGTAESLSPTSDIRCESVLFENDDDGSPNGNTVKIVVGKDAAITTALPGIRVGFGYSFTAPRGGFINLKDVFAIAGAAAQKLKVTILQ